MYTDQNVLGGEVVSINAPVLKHEAESSLALADAGVFETKQNYTDGYIYVKVVNAGTSSDLCLLQILDGTAAVVHGGANFAVAKDTASKFNVYIESGVLKVQNNIGGARDIYVSGIAL